MARRCNFGLALVAVAACAPAPAASDGPDAAQAVAMPGCTQEDMPATILVVRPADLPGGEIRFELALDAGRPAIRRYHLSPLRRDPAARPADLARAELRQGGRFAGWLLGTINLDRFEPGRGAAGSYRVVGPDGLNRSGRFDARWNADPAFCG